MSNAFNGKEEFKQQILALKGGPLVVTLMEEFADRSELPVRAWGDTSLRVPAEERDKHLICKEYHSNVVENVQQGKGLFLTGGAGTGKTTWAYKIATRYIWEKAQQGDLDAIPVYYVNIPSLMSDLKLAFKDDELQRKITSRIQDADLVIFDDIGAENATPWAKEQLYQFINYRYSNGKASLFTSNLPLSSLEYRVADRIKGTCTTVELLFESKR